MATTVADLKVKFSADGADKTKRDINDVSGAVDGANGRMGGFRSTLVGTFGGLLSYNMFSGMIGGLKDVGMGFINSNSQIEDFRQMLVVATGDMEKADAVLANMRDIAATSPFEFPELADAARVLESFGVSSEKWIPTIGNTAAATGKSIDQVTQALLDAQTGEFERLKELGIRTEVEGDKVRFSFMKNGKMMTVEAENTQEGIENALMGIWDDKYDGAMDQMSDTWTGRMANLKDNIGMMMQDAGKPIFELAKAGVGLANEWFDAFNEFRTKGMSPLNAGIAALGSVITAHLGAKAGAAFQKFATGAINAFDNVKEIVGDVAETIGDVLGEAFEFLVDHGDMVVGALKGIGVAFAALAGAAVVFGVIGGAIALVTSPLFILMAAAAALGVAWQTNFLGIRDITASVVDFLVGAFNTVKDAIQFIMDGFDTGGWSEAWERVKQIASDAWDGIKNLVTDAFDSIRDTISNVDWGAVWDTLVSGAQAAIGWVLDAIRNVDWGALIQGGWDVIYQGAQLAWDMIQDIPWDRIISGVWDIATWAAGKFTEIPWGTIAQGVWDIAKWAAGKFTEIPWSTIAQGTWDVAKWIANKFTAIPWGTIAVGTWDVVKWIANKFTAIPWSTIAKGTWDVASWIANKFTAIPWSTIISGLWDMASWALDLAGKAAAAIPWPEISFPSASDIANAIGSYVADKVGIGGDGNYDFEDTPTDVEAPPENVAGRPGAVQLGTGWDQPLDPSGLMGGANTGMFDAIVEAAQAAQAAIVSFVSTTIGVMGGWTTGIQTIVNSAADTLKSRASDATAGAAASFIAFVSQTIGVMGGWTTGIQTMVNTTMDALKSRASGGTAAALASFVAFVSQTIGVMGGWATGIQTMVNTTLDVLKERSSGGTSAAKASFTSFTSDTSASIRSWGSTVASTARSAMSDLASAVRSGMSSATASIRSESGAWSGIINAAAGALGAAGYNAGAAAGYGVANGLRAAQGSVAAAAADIIATVDAAMRKAGEIRSPSRRTGRVGKELTRGVASYMTSLDVMRDLQRAAGDVVGAVDGTLSTGMAGLSYGAPGLYSMPGGRAYAYAATAPVASGRSLSIGTINITQREGEDGEAFLDRVLERLASDFDDVGGLKGA